MNRSKNRLQERIGYHFSNEALFEQALSHRSIGANNNERLEFLGDAVLNLLVAGKLYAEFPEAKEGELTRMRAALVKGATLAEISREFGVGECLNLGGGERKSGGHRRDSILADALEAIVGAIYLEVGLEGSFDKIAPWFASRVEALTSPLESKDAKTRLQEWLQGRGKPLPEYRVLSTTGEAHNQVFTVSCSVGDLVMPSEKQGPSRRSAEQAAAGETLKKLRAK